MMFTGQAPVTGSQGLAGPVGIIQLSSEAFQGGYYLMLLALISINLAILNMLPLLPLDGGHVLFSIIERIRGRSISLRVFERVSMVGLALFVAAVHRGHVQRHRPHLRRIAGRGWRSRLTGDAGRRADGRRRSRRRPVDDQHPHRRRRGHPLARSGRWRRREPRLVRVAVPDRRAPQALAALVAESPVPLIADVHFDHRLAVAAVEAGVAGMRINPGNIGGRDEVREVVEAATEHGAVIRVGVNSGSLQRDLREMEERDPAGALVESAVRYVRPAGGVWTSPRSRCRPSRRRRSSPSRPTGCWPSGCPIRCIWG